MSSNSGKVSSNGVREVRNILISQPKPGRSPYFDLAEKYNIDIDWRPFIHVEPVAERDFRKNRIRPDDYSAVILTSKNAIDHFFRMCTEMRVTMPQSTKYFCISEAIANYLQKFIVYRKRKVFVGNRLISDLEPYLLKHKDSEKFLLPCSNLGSKPVTEFLDDNEFDYQEAMMYRTVSSDLSDLADITYDILVFFSPLGIQSLYENFPDFKQNNTRIAVYGKSTSRAVEERGLTINILAPAPNVPSMSMALDQYLREANRSNGSNQ
ncbi:MAG: uroporphyrinogen-III synthase [Saprospiraceae bacterium]|nr:uroporphyrinogen-III synthase [Saprospiraceae bacterium]